ncbi:MAG: polysaccharide deacetylase family protein [Clostridiales bacterium]|nr:polysaccharide deacetylase family protein [Clostridiales bacterium]
MNAMKKLKGKLPVLLAAFLILLFLSRISVPAFSENEEIEVGIVMYHSILGSDEKAGKYVITPEVLENDLRYLKEQGFTTVFISDLIEWVKNGCDLPKKPIVLSFDDGYFNNLSYALPLLEKYDMKAVISVIGRYTEEYSKSSDTPNNNYSHLTWDDLKELSSRFEILNHSYDLHSEETRMGLRFLPNESKASFQEKVGADIAKMQALLKEQLGINCRTFTYPYGYITEENKALIRNMGFEASLSCYEHINTLCHDPKSLFELGRYNRPYGISSEEFFSKIYS